MFIDTYHNKSINSHKIYVSSLLINYRKLNKHLPLRVLASASA